MWFLEHFELDIALSCDLLPDSNDSGVCLAFDEAAVVPGK